MKARVGTKQLEIAGLVGAARTNNFPDILFFAGGKVTTASLEAKFRIRLTLRNGTESDTIKKWNESLKSVPGGYGKMFEAKLLKRDLVEGDELEIKFEVDTGHGYEQWTPVDVQTVEGPPNTPAFSAVAFLFDNGQGVSGLVSLAYLNA